jgi:hypothetical protein
MEVEEKLIQFEEGEIAQDSSETSGGREVYTFSRRNIWQTCGRKATTPISQGIDEA